MGAWGKTSKAMASLVAMAALAGCGAFPNRVLGTAASAGKVRVKALGGPGHLFSDQHVVVTMRPGAKPPVAGAVVQSRIGLAELHRLPSGLSVEQALQSYAASPDVASVGKLELIPAEQSAPVAPAAPSIAVPQSAGDPLRWQQWSHEVAHVADAWETTRGRPDVVVAFLDTGVDDGHPDLRGQVVSGPDFGENKPNSRDLDDHGTHVAGIIGAKAEDGVGIAGVAPGSRMLAIKIFYPHVKDGKFQGNYTNAFAMAQGIQHAVTRGGAKVINISAGVPDDEVVESMFAMARGKGVVLCVSAGNQGRNAYSGRPKSMDGVLAVHATDAQDRLASFSNYGSPFGISAPGEKILSSIPTFPDPMTGQPRPATGYELKNGTSMASPFVAGVAALVASTCLDVAEGVLSDRLGREVKLKPTDVPVMLVEDILRQSAVDLGRPGRDEIFGAGRVDAARAVALAQSDDYVERLVDELIRNRNR